MKCTVRQGHNYRAEIQVTGLKKHFATGEDVIKRLKDAGFERVFVSPRGGGAFVAWGTWPGEDQTQDVDYVTKLEEL